MTADLEKLVKPLVWVATGQEGFLECQHYAVAGSLRHTCHPVSAEDGGFFEHYGILQERGTRLWHLTYWVGNNGLSGINATFLSLDAAKAAAQADYDARILSALDMQPTVSPDVAVLVEALRWYSEQTRLCRLIHKEGDAGRHALDGDGGKRARAAIAAWEASRA